MKISHLTFVDQASKQSIFLNMYIHGHLHTVDQGKSNLSLISEGSTYQHLLSFQPRSSREDAAMVTLAGLDPGTM